VVNVDGVDQKETPAALLHLLENGRRNGAPYGVDFDTGGILFLCGGPFAGMDVLRVRRGGIPEQPITADDLIAFGVGRAVSDFY